MKAEWLKLNDELKRRLAKVREVWPVLDHPLALNTAHIEELKRACNRNLEARCDVVVESMRRVLKIQAFQPSETLGSSLYELFHDLYSSGLAIVEKAFHDAIPEQDRPPFGTPIHITGIRDWDNYRVQVMFIAHLAELRDAAELPTNGAPAVWQEKLDYLQQQEAIVSDPAQKFALKKQIEEAEQKIREFGG